MMRRWTQYMMLMPVLLVQALSSCVSDDAPIDESEGGVEVSLAFSLSSSTKSQTRMTADVVQNNNNYRGISEWHVIPFEVQGRKIEATDLAKRERVNSMEQDFDRADNQSWFYYNQHCQFMRGVASFLVYGRANTANADRSTYGSLTAVFPADMNPIGITFAPTPIYTSTPHAKANALAAYLTAIANTQVTHFGTNYKWGNLTSPAIKAMYQNFIGQENVTAIDIAGSSNNVIKYVNELYTNVSSMLDSYADGVEHEMCDAILDQIVYYPNKTNPVVTFDNTEKKITSLGDDMSGFPANIGLPDGAAVLRWTGEKFEPQTQTTTMDNITGIARYAYPAELYYHANSLIRTSNQDDRENSYAKQTWDAVLADYENENGVVNGNTTAVAIIDMLQYGVAHLQVKLKKVATNTLTDAAGNAITIGSNQFPLTAIIVGNQHKVGFDFKPCGDEDYFMYDPNVTSGTYLSSSAYQNGSEVSDVSAVTHTLVLQSKDRVGDNEEEIALVAEFENNSSQTIEGVNHGLIYPGTKFYLVAKVKPSDAMGENVEKLRVFTQDCITTMTLNVESLAKAYNIVPNLLSPRLEIGVQVVTDWMQAEPTNVMLE